MVSFNHVFGDRLGIHEKEYLQAVQNHRKPPGTASTLGNALVAAHSSKAGRAGYELPKEGDSGAEAAFLTETRSPEKEAERLGRSQPGSVGHSLLPLLQSEATQKKQKLNVARGLQRIPPAARLLDRTTEN